MLTKTTATATASLSVVSALSSTTPSPFLCHFTPNNSRFFTPPNLLSNFLSIRWNTNKHNTYTNKNKCNNFGTSRMESFTIKASAQPLKNAEELINSVETFIFDCDGEGSYYSFLTCFVFVKVIWTRTKLKKNEDCFNGVGLNWFLCLLICVVIWGRFVVCTYKRANMFDCLWVCLG